MNAIQFKTYARHGMIKIPNEYPDFWDKKLNVIILAGVLPISITHFWLHS